MGKPEPVELLYLDYNCFQRGFDDQRQIRIRIEALACQEIFLRAEAGEIQLIWSFMHEDETALCPFPERKYAVLQLAALCKVRIGPNEDIYKLAKKLVAEGKLTAKDAVHLACALYAGARFFLTCDDRLVKKVKALKLNIEIMNPVDYIRREVSDGRGKTYG